jgi:hypothetical protein
MLLLLRIYSPTLSLIETDQGCIAVRGAGGLVLQPQLLEFESSLVVAGLCSVLVFAAPS